MTLKDANSLLRPRRSICTLRLVGLILGAVVGLTASGSRAAAAPPPASSSPAPSGLPNGSARQAAQQSSPNLRQRPATRPSPAASPATRPVVRAAGPKRLPGEELPDDPKARREYLTDLMRRVADGRDPQALREAERAVRTALAEKDLIVFDLLSAEDLAVVAGASRVVPAAPHEVPAELRQEAISANKRAVPQLVALVRVKDQDPRVRSSALFRLENELPRLDEEFLKMLSDADPAVRASGMSALRNVRLRYDVSKLTDRQWGLLLQAVPALLPEVEGRSSVDPVATTLLRELKNRMPTECGRTIVSAVRANPALADKAVTVLEQGYPLPADTRNALLVCAALGEDATVQRVASSFEDAGNRQMSDAAVGVLVAGFNSADPQVKKGAGLVVTKFRPPLPPRLAQELAGADPSSAGQGVRAALAMELCRKGPNHFAQLAEQAVLGADADARNRAREQLALAADAPPPPDFAYARAALEKGRGWSMNDLSSGGDQLGGMITAEFRRGLLFAPQRALRQHMGETAMLYANAYSPGTEWPVLGGPVTRKLATMAAHGDDPAAMRKFLSDAESPAPAPRSWRPPGPLPDSAPASDDHAATTNSAPDDGDSAVSRALRYLTIGFTALAAIGLLAIRALKP